MIPITAAMMEIILSTLRGRRLMRKSPQMEQHSRRQTQTLEPPPELPPAPPRKALIIVGLVLLVLLVAGAATLIGRAKSGARSG